MEKNGIYRRICTHLSVSIGVWTGHFAPATVGKNEIESGREYLFLYACQYQKVFCGFLKEQHCSVIAPQVNVHSEVLKVIII